jgi:hypothetical protein
MTTTAKIEQETDEVRQSILYRRAEAHNAILEQKRVIKALQEATSIAYGVMHRAQQLEQWAETDLRDHDYAKMQAETKAWEAETTTMARRIPKPVEGENGTWICPEPGCGEVRDTQGAYYTHWAANH